MLDTTFKNREHIILRHSKQNLFFLYLVVRTHNYRQLSYHFAFNQNSHSRLNYEVVNPHTRCVYPHQTKNFQNHHRGYIVVRVSPNHYFQLSFAFMVAIKLLERHALSNDRYHFQNRRHNHHHNYFFYWFIYPVAGAAVAAWPEGQALDTLAFPFDYYHLR